MEKETQNEWLSMKIDMIFTEIFKEMKRLDKTKQHHKNWVHKRTLNVIKERLKKSLSTQAPKKLQDIKHPWHTFGKETL